MRIEPATVEDCAAIGDLHVRAWQQAYAHIFPAELLAARSAASSEAFWRERLEQGEPWLLVARSDDGVIGFVAFGASRDADAAPGCGEIWAIYVAPESWSKGAGRQLCAAALDALRACGCQRATLWVLAKNERALRFYRSVGFEVDPASDKDFEVAGARVREIRCSYPLRPRTATA